MTEDWQVRAATSDDRPWLEETLREELRTNSYFHGVPAKLVAGLSASVAAPTDEWRTDVVTTADEDHEPAGWVIYREVPALTIAHAYVEDSFRGLGAWRALREHVGLKRGQLVNVILASPQAMSLARKVYMAKHNWGQILGWLT